MTKETIITDAISYIEELQNNVKELSSQLLEMEATSGVEVKSQTGDHNTDAAAEDMRKFGIEVNVFIFISPRRIMNPLRFEHYQLLLLTGRGSGGSN